MESDAAQGPVVKAQKAPSAPTLDEWVVVIWLWFFCISSPPRRISISVVQSGVLYDRVCQFCVDCHANFLTRGSRSIPRTASMRFYDLRARHLPIAGVHPVVQIFDGVRRSEHQVVIHVSALPDSICHAIVHARVQL